MLQEAGLIVSSKYWAEAVNTAIYLTNRSLIKAIKGMTTEEAQTGKKINLEHLRVFGSRGFVHVSKQKRTKWDPKSKEMIFVGYCENSKAYRLMDRRNPLSQIQKARDVVFLEVQDTEKLESLMNLEVYQQEQPDSKTEGLDETQESFESEFVDAKSEVSDFEDQ